MKTLSFAHLDIQPTTKARSRKEDLIEQIVAQCHFRKKGDDRKLAKLLAIATNTCNWTDTDLHALMKKKSDPTIRNYSAFVWWTAKITNKQ